MKRRKNWGYDRSKTRIERSSDRGEKRIKLLSPDSADRSIRGQIKVKCSTTWRSPKKPPIAYSLCPAGKRFAWRKCAVHAASLCPAFRIHPANHLRSQRQTDPIAKIWGSAGWHETCLHIFVAADINESWILKSEPLSIESLLIDGCAKRHRLDCLLGVLP